MKVYCVIEICFGEDFNSEEYLRGVFKTERKAKNYIKKYSDKNCEYRIDIFKLN